MLEVFLETKNFGYCETVAIVADEEAYSSLLPAIEQIAEENNFAHVTERRLEDSGFTMLQADSSEVDGEELAVFVNAALALFADFCKQQSGELTDDEERTAWKRKDEIVRSIDIKNYTMQ